ncbi:MAG: thiamine-phosphate kinase, partial [Psychrobacter sp.]|nr:thiamine-phosphate kinase [Psychrobacter sp.]
MALAHRLHMPTPRIVLGAALTKIGATAMIDISDGLYQDLGHICQQSAVNIRLNLEQLPSSTPLSAIDLSERLLCQLAGGDDYELAFTLPAHVTPPASNVPVTYIGDVIAIADNVGATADTTIPMCPELYYQGQSITPTHPAPFTTWPTLTGYQHFTG